MEVAVIQKWVFLAIEIVRFDSQHASHFVRALFLARPAFSVRIRGSLDQNLVSWFVNG